MQINMLKSRGGGFQIDLVYPTASVKWRKRGDTGNIVEGDVGEENIVVEMVHVVEN